jgi:hypothetical protein
VERLGAPPPRVELLRDLVHLGPGPAEDDRGGRVLEVEDAGEGGELVGSRHDVGRLLHPPLALRRRSHLAGRPEPQLRRRGEAARGQDRDARRERGREERHRTPVGRRVEDRLEVLREAHVEHLVRFVEDDELHSGERERPAPDVVERPARRRDDDVHPALERPQL